MVGDYTSAAAHVSDLGLRTAFFVILRIKRRIQEREIREQPLCRNPAGQFEQVVVGFARIVVDPFLHLEDMDGENGGLAVAEPGFGRQHDRLGHHAAFRSGIGSIVNRRKRNLRTGTGMHGVQVVHQRLHCLIGGPFGLLIGGFTHKFLHFRNQLSREVLLQFFGFLFQHAILVFQCGKRADGLIQLAYQSVRILTIGEKGKRFGKISAVEFGVGLRNARRHAVIEVRDALPAVLVVLIGLDGDAGKRRITGDIIRLPQKAVAGRETAFKQLFNIDLAAGSRQGEKIQVMDVDIPFVCLLYTSRCV